MNAGKHPHGKAAALLSYALDIEAQESIGRDRLQKLVDDVCEDDMERARLVSILSTSQSHHLPKVVSELLSARLDRVNDRLDTAEDMDAVYGIWGQRVSGGALLASVGFFATGVVTGGWGVLAISAAVLSGAAISYGRDRLRRRVRAARRNVEQTKRLIEAIQ